MGQISQKITCQLFPDENIKVFLNGNSGSGRTTLLYMWTLNKTVQTIPTIGFNVEQVRYNDTTFEMWDAGGGYRMRELWHHYMEGVQAFITVVDSSFDIYDTKELLQNTTVNLLQKFDKKIPFLILANKNDRSTHTDEEILEHVGLYKYIDKVDYHLIRTNCFSGEGLVEALDWLEQKTRNLKK